MNLRLLLFLCFLTNQTQAQLDSLKELLSETDSVHLLAKYHEEIGVLYWEKGSLEEAESSFKKAIRYDSIQSDSIGIANGFSNLGLLYTEKGILPIALAYFDKALVTFQKDSNRYAEEISITLLNNANALNRAGLANEAIIDILKAIDGFEKIKYKRGLAYATNTLGNIFQEVGRFTKAEEYFSKSKILSVELNDRLGIAMILHNLALLEDNKENLPKAIGLLKESLDIKKILGLELKTASTLLKISEVYFKLGREQKAIDFAEQSLIIRRKHNDKDGIVASLLQLSELNKYSEEAKKHLDEAEKLVELIQSNDLKLELIKHQQRYFEKNAQLSKAYSKLNAYKELEDLMRSESLQLKLLVLETRYNKANDQKEIAELNEENTAKALALQEEKQRSFELQVLSLLLILTAIGVIAFVYLFQKQQLLKRMMNAKSEGELDERRRISRDLHDGIASHLSLVQRGLETAQLSIQQKDILNLPIHQLKETTKEIGLLSNELYSRDLFLGHFSLNLRRYLLEWGLAHSIELKLENHAEKELDNLKEKAQRELFLVIVEIMRNTNKHANATILKVNIVLKKRIIFIETIDNGTGFKLGTSQKGNGIRNIKDRIEVLGGGLMIQSDFGKETRYFIKLPIRKLKK